MHYAIGYKNSAGLTQRSEFLPFDSDEAAIVHGRLGERDNSVVEIWKGDDLLLRLVRGAPAAGSAHN